MAVAPRLMRLSPRLQEVVDLVGGEGLSYDAAARRMGLSVRTVEEYAAEIRTMAGLRCNPRSALFLLYRADGHPIEGRGP